MAQRRRTPGLILGVLFVALYIGMVIRYITPESTPRAVETPDPTSTPTPTSEITPTARIAALGPTRTATVVPDRLPWVRPRQSPTPTQTSSPMPTAVPTEIQSTRVPVQRG